MISIPHLAFILALGLTVVMAVVLILSILAMLIYPCYVYAAKKSLNAHAVGLGSPAYASSASTRIFGSGGYSLVANGDSDIHVDPEYHRAYSKWLTRKNYFLTAGAISALIAAFILVEYILYLLEDPIARNTPPLDTTNGLNMAPTPLLSLFSNSSSTLVPQKIYKNCTEIFERGIDAVVNKYAAVVSANYLSDASFSRDKLLSEVREGAELLTSVMQHFVNQTFPEPNPLNPGQNPALG